MTTTPNTRVIDHCDAAHGIPPDAHAFQTFLSDLLNLDRDDFVDALIDLFGLDVSHIEPSELKAMLDLSPDSNRLTIMSELIANGATRNLKLRNTILRQVNSASLVEPKRSHESEPLATTSASRHTAHLRESDTSLPIVALDFLDEDWFLSVYQSELRDCTDVRTHFLEHARQQHWYPVFLTKIQKQTLLQTHQNNPKISSYLESLTELNHASDLYIKYRIAQSGLFLGDWYRARYPDIRSLSDPLMHYVAYGEREGRRPNPYFDPIWYRMEHDITPQPSLLVHYLDIGRHLGFQPSELFNASVYRNLLRQVGGADVAGDELALVQYLEKGAKWIGEPSFSSVDSTFKIAVANLSLDSIERSTTSFGHALRIVLACSEVDRSKALSKATQTLNSQLKDKRKVKHAIVKRVGFDPDALNIVWIIPDFEKGGGGHTTIFRMIKLLAVRGHRQTVLISNRMSRRDGAEARDMIFRDFFVSDTEVYYLDELEEDELGSPDVVVATSFETLAPALRTKASKRFYFVQDYEPYFHPAGSLALLAENTYKADVDCICASPWLKGKMEGHGRWATSFYLGVDDTVYFQASPTTDGRAGTRVPRIVLYGRAFTPRRCVELAVAALIRLAELGVVFHVDIIHGDSLPDELTLPFSNARYATLSPQELANLYRKGTLGVVFSGTNYSLMPQEMLACGLEVVDIISESTTATYPDSVVHLVEPDPLTIANKLGSLLGNQRSAVRRDAINHWLRHSWDDACDVVNSAFIERLDAIGLPRAIGEKSASSVTRAPKASVVIPVYNGMRELPTLMQKLLAQRAPWPFEIIAIDSSSSDGSYEFLQQHPQVQSHRIPKHEFGHGRTRNLGCELAKGQFVAFLTQDAYPVSPFWLYDLVTSLEIHPDAAGVFGRHVAHAYATPFTKRDIEDFFAQFYNGPSLISIATEWSRYGIPDSKAAEFIRYYSDNNSCMRRKVWEEFPYPDIEYGEDQVWAYQVCLAGFSKIYAHQAVVAHSHDYDVQQTFERAQTEAEFFLRYFGIEVLDPASTAPVLERLISDINAVDERWGRENNVATDLIDERRKINASRINGYIAGIRRQRAQQGREAFGSQRRKQQV